MNTPQTDTPETDRLSKRCDSFEQFITEFEIMERRAIAAESRVKELEKIRDDNMLLEPQLASARQHIHDLDEQLAQARAALRLRPIAEAGPVPEGMIRIFMSWSSVEGYVIDHIYKATYAIDIYPPQQ